MARTTDELLARVHEISEAVSQLGPMLIGTLLEKRNRKRRQDGSEYVSAPYYTFQYRDADGRRRWRRMPRSQKARARKLIETGARYQALEREYAALTTQLGLLDPSKKND
jgi:hypothetical protein